MKGKKIVIILVVVLAALGIFAGVVVANAKNRVEGILDNPLEVFDSAEEEASAQPVASDHVDFDDNADVTTISFDGKNYAKNENVINVLLLGIDSDAEREKQQMGWRSDMIMLASVNPDTNKISFVSIPRDTRSNVYHVDAEGKRYDPITTKLNAAYAFGGGPKKFSAENAMSATSAFLETDGKLNIPINYYMSIDLGGLSKLGDALNGVTVTLDQSVPEIGKKGETVTLKGNDVRLFLQNRYDMSDGEMTRQKHEQMFIKAMALKIKEMGAKESAPALFETFTKFMRTNLNLDQIIAFASILDNASMEDLDFRIFEDGHFESLLDENSGKNGSFYIPSQDEVLRDMVEITYNEVG